MSWVVHSRHSLEAQLLSSLLLTSDGKKCKLYLRLRKYILQLANASVLDELVLRHEDVISSCGLTQRSCTGCSPARSRRR